MRYLVFVKTWLGLGFTWIGRVCQSVSKPLEEGSCPGKQTLGEPQA